jgi:hypothetical protein
VDIDTIIGLTRKRLGDTSYPPLYSDDLLIAYANEAEREACRRAQLIRDNSDATICTITMTTDVATYAISPFVLDIFEVTTSLGTDPLVRTTKKDLNAEWAGWRSASSDIPQCYIFEGRTLTLVSPPNADGTISLDVTRLPKTEMELEQTPSDSPEIDSQYHAGLINYICYLAYSQDDPHTIDYSFMRHYGTLFAMQFGPPLNERKLNIMRDGAVRNGLEPRKFG